jgi:hypothetical protein
LFLHYMSSVPPKNSASELLQSSMAYGEYEQHSEQFPPPTT